MSGMRFLITNDDGFDAPGLESLYHALSPLGAVDVVAPAVCHSAKGHAVNTKDPIRVRRFRHPRMGLLHIVESSPADCVRVGLRGLGLPAPCYVIAGINPGANLGVDLFYSGTAAAAREAAIMGVPSAAVSRYMRPGIDMEWDRMSACVTEIIRQVTENQRRLPGGQFWNINFPAVPVSQFPSELTFAPQGLQSHDIRFAAREESDDSLLLDYVGDYSSRDRSGECDVSRVFEDRITATPIDLCTTAEHPAVRQSQQYPVSASPAD